MGALLVGLIVLLLLVGMGRGVVSADPKRLARQLRYGGGGIAVAAGVVFSAMGREILGVPLIGIGLGLLGRNALPGFAWFGSRSDGGAPSRMSSPNVEIDLDGRGDIVGGRVLAGRLAGRDLAGLSAADAGALLSDLAAADPRGSGLLEAYLDRRRPGWREHLNGDAGRRGGKPAGEAAMTEQQAYQILGLEPGADPAEIQRAHRALMMKLHPDQGGSTYLAVQVNAAKDLLLRHR